MFIADIKRVVEQVSRDKGIDAEILIRALEEALRSAAKKKFGSKVDIEAQYSPDTGEIEVFQFKEVVEDITEPDLQVDLVEGRKLDPDCEVGDSLGTKMDTSTFGRIAAQSAKQVIIQKMKDAERDAVYSSYIDRKGDVINGIVQRVDRGNIIVNLGTTEAILPTREQIPRENYRRGDRIRALIFDVLYDTRGPQIVLSRTHPDLLINLFKTEVPEISEGIVEIKGAAREPGSRAKFAVSSNDSDIDPVGACVGMKGSRVQNVVQELRGEKIDIITWHVDAAKYVCNALAPAEIARVIIDEEDKSMEVIVPDEFLSVAIGKRGQNVRLASKLTGWHLDVNSESKYNEMMEIGYESLVNVPGVGAGLADAFVEKGIYSAEELSEASVEELVEIRGIGQEKAVVLIENSRQFVVEAAESKRLEYEARAEAQAAQDEAQAAPDEAEAAPDEVQAAPDEAEAAPDEAEAAPDEVEPPRDEAELARDETETTQDQVDAAAPAQAPVDEAGASAVSDAESLKEEH